MPTIAPPTSIYTSSVTDQHDVEGHPERPERTSEVARRLREGVLGSRILWREPRAATDAEIGRVHDPRLYEIVLRLEAAGGGWIDADTYVVPGTVASARLAAGAAVEAALVAARGQGPTFSLMRPPGHHATRARPMGFCISNNVAIAGVAALEETGVSRVLIFDHDLHHGNGTQDMFYDRSDVLYVSFHQSPHYPGTGAVDEIGEGEGKGYTVNLPVPAGTGDTEVAALMTSIIMPVARRFDPDLVLVSAGFDSHAGDPLGDLRLSSSVYGWLLGELMSIQPRLAAMLEGGYVIENISGGVASELATMLGGKTTRPVDDSRPVPAVSRTIEESRRELGPYWGL